LNIKSCSSKKEQLFYLHYRKIHYRETIRRIKTIQQFNNLASQKVFNNLPIKKAALKKSSFFYAFVSKEELLFSF